MEFFDVLCLLYLPNYSIYVFIVWKAERIVTLLTSNVVGFFFDVLWWVCIVFIVNQFRILAS